MLPTRVAEAFGLSALEFMSQGVPVVASASGGIPEIIADGTDGLLVEPGNPEALARAIRHLVADREVRESIGSEAKKKIETQFGYEEFFKKISDIYESAFTRKR